MEHNFNIHLKRLGKKKVKIVNLTLETEPKTIKELIEACVTSEVKKYNQKRKEIQLLSFLTPENIEEQSKDGKIGFGDIENKILVKLDRALNNALLAHKDGLFIIFIDEVEVENMNTKIDLRSDTIITFLRMTFLTGTYWQ